MNPSYLPCYLNWGVETDEPKHPYPKYDRITKGGIRIQIKGTSKSLTDKEKLKIGSEVMGTHGKGAIRCYNETEFDYLGMVIDPGILPIPGISPDLPEIPQKIDPNIYHFCLIPITALPLHYKNGQDLEGWKDVTDKLYPICKFRITTVDNRLCLMPENNYRVDVHFRQEGPWFIDALPDNFS